MEGFSELISTVISYKKVKSLKPIFTAVSYQKIFQSGDILLLTGIFLYLLLILF
jgi:hypothetical protein